MPLTRPRYSSIVDADYKQSVRVATTEDVGNIAAGGNMTDTVDTIGLALNDRILVKDQTDGTQNGIYYVSVVGTGSDGTWVRAKDANSSTSVTSGMTTIVAEGSANGSKTFRLTTADPITLGTTSLTFTNPFGATTAGGGNTQVQYNSTSALAGSPGFTFDVSSNTVAIGGNVTVDNTLRIAQSGSGLRMTNVGAFDNDGSDNFRIFATNDLILAANGDSGTAITIDATNQDVAVSNDLTVSGELTVDTNTLHVNPTNNRVGIGTTTPAYQVEIENTGSNALLVLDRTDGASTFIEGGATASVLGSVGANDVKIAYNSVPVVTIGSGGAITTSGNITAGNLRADNLTTQNAFAIVGSDNNLIQDTTLSVDPASNFLGINQTSPEVTLHMTGEGAQTAQIRMEQYNDSADAPDIRTRRYRGNIASPSAVSSGDYLFRSNHEYYNGTSLLIGGAFAFDNTNNANRTEYRIAVDTDGTGGDILNGWQFKIDGNDSGAITFNNAYKFPTADGSANNILATDGSGALTFTGDPTFTTVSTGNLTITGSVTGNLVPSANVTYSLGSENFWWDSLYLSGGTIYLGGLSIKDDNGKIGFFDRQGNTRKSIGNVQTVAATGNVTTDQFFIGNGSQLTGLSSTVKNYVDGEISGLVDSAPDTLNTLNEIASALGDDPNLATTLTTTITTANTAMRGYVDGEITTVDSAITTANLAMVGYVDDAVTTANSAVIGYVDNAVTTANSAVVGYVDNAVTTANTAMKGYVDGEIAGVSSSYGNTEVGAYLPTYSGNVGANYVNANFFTGNGSQLTGLPAGFSNVQVLAYLTTNSYATESYVTQANVGLKGYTDAQLTAKAPLADPDFTGQVEINNILELGNATSPGISVNHTATNNEGIFWHTNNTNYAIYRTSGTWSAPDYQQLKLDWPTGIVLNPGSAYGKSFVDVQGQLKTTSFTLNGVDITATGTELNYVDGVTSAIQTQLDAKASLSGAAFTGEISSTGDIYAGGGNMFVNSGNQDVKYGLWGDNGLTYGIGMTGAVTFGGLNDYAMTFCMNNDTDRGFWWGYSGQTKSDGAMSLTTAGVLTVKGDITTVNGVFSGTATSARYADLAEKYISDKDYAPGTVVVFGGPYEITESTQTHQRSIAGVISTKPAYLMNSDEDGLPVALQGRVPCQVLGPIRKGDLVVASEHPGIAQRLNDAMYRPGCVIGKALNDIETAEIVSIEVVVGRL